MQIAPEIKNRKPVMRDITFREFKGGWNTADADPGLDQSFSTRSENMMLHGDGRYGVRFGTQYRGDIAIQDTTYGTIAMNSFTTTNGSAVVVIRHPGHGLLGGHSITLSGCADLGGILAVEFNTAHDITYIDADTYSIVTASLATATATGQPAVSFSHDNKTVNSPVINMKWFQGRFVVVCESGVIAEVSTDGICRIIFDIAIAGKLIGAPTGWSSGLRFASFATFNGELMIFNGVDKPLLVNFENEVPVTYLQDLATGSNFNTPVTRYGVSVDDFVVLFGDVENPDLVSISSSGTSGTYLGDPPPNDAVEIELGKRVQSIANTLRGGGRYRDKLILVFDDVTAIGTLGIFDTDGNHEPDFSDAVDEYGGIAHRSMLSLGDDFLMADTVGVPSLSRTTISNTIRPERVSDAIEAEIQESLSALSTETQEDRVYAVFNRLEGQYMLFIPNSDDVATTTETMCYVLSYNRKKALRAWSRFRGWNFRCGDRTINDELYFFSGTKLYHYGSAASPYAADFIGDPDIEDTTNGDPIDFDWELPWNDFGTEARFKVARYVQLTSVGTAQFDLSFYADFILTNGNGDDAPQVTLPMVGGSVLGFGGGEQPYGGGRVTNDPRPYAFNMKFKRLKARIRGSVRAPLRFSAMTYFYHLGSMRA